MAGPRRQRRHGRAHFVDPLGRQAQAPRHPRGIARQRGGAFPADDAGPDPQLVQYGDGVPHPRGYGSTARVLGRYRRERGVLSLEAAIAKLSAVPAARLGLTDRGVVREGRTADLVAFDATTVHDEATY